MDVSWTIRKAECHRIDTFWTIVLEKTLESPLDCKEIKPVNPEGNQSWIFIAGTDAEAEAPILWPPDQKTHSLEKSLKLGKTEGKWKRRRQRMNGWMASPTQWTWVWASSRSWRWTGKPGVLQSMELQSRTWLSDWTDTATIGRGGSKINFDGVGLILGVLQSMGSQGLGHDLVTEQQQIFILVWRFAYLLV